MIDMPNKDTNGAVGASPMPPVLCAAIQLYRPPFSYCHGYIHDGEGHMVADDGAVDELRDMIACRVRGWGRLQYLEGAHTPEHLQDAVGEHIAKALNEYWSKHLPVASV